MRQYKENHNETFLKQVEMEKKYCKFLQYFSQMFFKWSFKSSNMSLMRCQLSKNWPRFRDVQNNDTFYIMGSLSFTYVVEILSTWGEMCPHGLQRAFSLSKTDTFSLHIRSQLVRGVNVQGIKIMRQWNAAETGRITVIMIKGPAWDIYQTFLSSVLPNVYLLTGSLNVLTRRLSFLSLPHLTSFLSFMTLWVVRRGRRRRGPWQIHLCIL